jgi:ankyrin repeat protein
MRHNNKKSAANLKNHFLRLCLVLSAVAGTLFSAACAALPVGNQSQLELIETIRNPRRTDFAAVLARTSGLNFVDESGKTPLMYAVERSNAAQIKALIKHGADPAIPDTKGYTALHYAAVMPGSDSLKAILETGAKADVPGGERIQKKTPLMEAARLGEVRNVELLLKHGADPKICDARKRTPLMFAASAPKYSARIVKMLLAKGAERLKADEDGNTALFMAIKAKNQETALYLLSLFPNFNKKDANALVGLAAMKYAIDAGNLELVKAVLAKRLPVNMDLSVIYRSLRFATLEGWYEILAENGVIEDGKTPLFWAAAKDQLAIVKYLLENGADPAARDHAGTSPEDYARKRETVRLIKDAAKKKREEQLRQLEKRSQI